MMLAKRLLAILADIVLRNSEVPSGQKTLYVNTRDKAEGQHKMD
tara:strand:+ start:140 stop:271 length:132 start_codon:yes stop_codon:yes gene_type:complete